MARPEQLSVGFWIDAGAEVGGGHATRTRCLARELTARGHRFRVAAEHPREVAAATRNQLEAAHARLEEMVSWGCDCWIVDRPHTDPAPAEHLARLRVNAPLLVCFDANDAAGAVCDVHISVLPRPVATGAALRLAGPRYAVIPAGDESRAGSAASEDAPADVLFAFGAADPAALSEAAVPVAAELADEFDVNLIVGPLVPAARRAALRTRTRDARLEVFEAPGDVARCMAGVRVAVLPFGLMLFEAISLGASIVMWHPSAAHAEVGRRFAAACAPWPCAGVGWGRAAAPRVADAVRRLAASPRPARPPVDRRGAQRIVDALEEAFRARSPRADAAPSFAMETG